MEEDMEALKLEAEKVLTNKEPSESNQNRQEKEDQVKEGSLEKESQKQLKQFIHDF